MHGIAWAAGVFEGEGSISVHKSNGGRNKYPMLQMSMTDQDVMITFAEIVGGKVNGPYRYKEPHKKPYFKWATYNAEALEVFGRLKPFLHSRRCERMEEVMEVVSGESE